MYSSVTVSGLVAKLIRWIRRPILKEKLQSYVPVDRLSFHWWMLLQSNNWDSQWVDWGWCHCNQVSSQQTPNARRLKFSVKFLDFDYSGYHCFISILVLLDFAGLHIPPVDRIYDDAVFISLTPNPLMTTYYCVCLTWLNPLVNLWGIVKKKISNSLT